MAEPLSKSQIRNIMRAEHKSAGITKINPGLYRALNQYLDKLHQAYIEAHAENKTQKALTLTKEIRDTERDISTIYELRERKILLTAQDIVRGGAPSLKHLFPEEKLLLLRLSSILLAMRKDIRIDFHHRVDNYIKTIAKEYDLERKLFAPFHPTDPFCEDVNAIQKQGVTATATSGGSALNPEEPNTPPSPPLPNEESVITPEEPVAARIEEPGKNREEENGIDPIDLSPKLTDPADSGDSEPDPVEVNTVEEEVTADVSAGSEEDAEVTTGSDAEVTTASDENIAGIDDGEGIDEVEEEDDDEPESVDFLKENSVVGTLDSIPQFRGSDLHDYRFENGEIVTLPTKMAEVLEKQGKLFIIGVDNK